MGSAAESRKENRKRFLARLATECPERFPYHWERRVDSWMIEIRLAAREWASGGDTVRSRIFPIVETAMETLAACGPEAWERYAAWTHGVLVHECTARVAGIVDPRLYRLSNMAVFETHGRKTRVHQNQSKRRDS